MRLTRTLLSIGFNENNEPSFSISEQIAGLSLEEMRQIIAIIPVAIDKLQTSKWNWVRENMAARRAHYKQKKG